ncbi:DUF2793 domain-containing protein [Rhizobium sp. TRM96647]|uniref:DUF2793 domain-containing protein n=1 Tax=unclassified Rhizobium TaxID=2613769 RepID=UPI0021E92854|nr:MULTISPECIES: DUF2793 domain-containing protein [unclassified Rhizobium]MCV3735802.1 DUF2793 domain-containing protein [Rhizobium sp. TRM96647]MCV3758536.1 DUF2793 domain-containing protein [Rhizobium sp. TRM96650]
MQDQTARLGLPYILPSQAQKHVSHNEGLDALDMMVQLVLADIADAPPPAPADGACYGVAAAPAGAWSGMAGWVAQWRDGGWHFLQSKAGWLAWCALRQRLHVHDGTGWQPFTQIGDLPTLGINTAADETNRLALSAPASLFSHQGNDHRLKINKAGPDDTASLIFQNNWNGLAEMGLAGNDDFAIKVADGSGGWRTALGIDPSGHVATPHRPAARAWLSNPSLSPAVGSLTGFTETGFAIGGFTLGAPVPGGNGNRLVAPASALYLMCLSAVPVTQGPLQVEVVLNGATPVLGTGPQSGAPIGRKICACGIVSIARDEWIALQHQGSVALEFGFNGTELSIVALT